MGKLEEMCHSIPHTEIFALSFDKWWTPYGEKFIGVYLHAMNKQVCLDLIYYQNLLMLRKFATIYTSKPLAIFNIQMTKFLTFNFLE